MKENDILNGLGMFNFKSNQELLKKWQIVNPERYDIKLSKEKSGEKGKEITENVIAITKKKDAPQLFDDGLLLKFDLQQPEHVTFQCKTDS